MSPEKHLKDEHSELEALMPWYVAGTLDAETTQRIDAALEHSAVLQKALHLTLEEQEQTIRVNEELGMPSSAALSNLMRAIEAEPQPMTARGALARLSGWLGARFAAVPPLGLGVSAAAAALLICIQAGLLAGLYFKEAPQGVVYETASHGESAVKAEGLKALVAFAPELKTGEMEALLSANGLQIIDGPRPGGFYLLRFAAGVDQAAAEKTIAALSARADAVRFMALSE